MRWQDAFAFKCYAFGSRVFCCRTYTNRTPILHISHQCGKGNWVSTSGTICPMKIAQCYLFIFCFRVILQFIKWVGAVFGICLFHWNIWNSEQWSLAVVFKSRTMPCGNQMKHALATWQFLHEPLGSHARNNPAVTSSPCKWKGCLTWYSSLVGRIEGWKTCWNRTTIVIPLSCCHYADSFHCYIIYRLLWSGLSIYIYIYIYKLSCCLIWHDDDYHHEHHHHHFHYNHHDIFR